MQATAERRKQVFGFLPINCPIQQKQHIILMRFFKIWGPRGILCTRGEKEHTSKRASIILIMRFQTRSVRRGDIRARQQRSGKACISKRACSVTGAQGRKDLRKGGETALFEPANCFPTHKKSTTHNVARFLMWWGQQGSNL